MMFATRAARIDSMVTCEASLDQCGFTDWIA